MALHYLAPPCRKCESGQDSEFDHSEQAVFANAALDDKLCSKITKVYLISVSATICRFQNSFVDVPLKVLILNQISNKETN